MSATTPQMLVAVKRLIDEGIIPPLCRKFVLSCEVNQLIVMNLEVYVTREQMDKIAAALIDNPEEAKRIARDIVFVEHGALDGESRFAQVKL
jgi:hypothetical protein